jgi:peptidoglycan/xylan/chitin deacetylase (PgdA/CDA1 family)
VIVTFDDGYRSNYTLAFPVLRRNAQKATVFVALDPDDHTRAQVAGFDDFLRPAELREMADSGISIQSHSLTHRILTELPDEEVRFELEESCRRLEEITGRAVRHLAIPRAGYSQRVRQIAREVGYSTVCCNNKGTANGLSNPLALPRIVVDREMSREEFGRALRPAGGVILRVVGNLKRIPERIGGARFARRVRDLLYRGPLRHAFTTRNLKRAVVIAALAYLCGGVIFALRLLGA